MTIRRIFAMVFCLALLSGCAQSMKQHSNIVNAINTRPNLTAYNKTCIFSMFGYPDSSSVSFSDGHCTQVWTYKTIRSNKDLLVDMRPKKARYMKITITDNIIADVSFE